MDYNNQDDNRGNMHMRSRTSPGDSMAGSALVLSVVAIITTIFVYPSIICGAVSITMALLSRGAKKKMPSAGTLAVTLSALALLLTIALVVLSFVYIIYQYGSVDAFMESYMNTVEQLTEMTGGSSL